MHRELIEIARDLASRDAVGPPKQASLAKSVSSAYYAVFHALAELSARETIGNRYWADLKIVYRSLDHGRTKAAIEELIRQPGNLKSSEQLEGRLSHFSKNATERITTSDIGALDPLCAI